MLMRGEIDTDERDEVVDLVFIDIDECSSASDLSRWYVNARELADDIIAQIETERETDARGAEWIRRASGMLIGLKKKMKRIERRCLELGLPNPKPPEPRPTEITRLTQKLGEARHVERQAIIDWLADAFGDAAAPAIRGIEQRHYVRFRRSAEPTPTERKDRHERRS